MRQQKGPNSSPPRNVRRQENGRTYKQSFKRQLFVSKWCNGSLFWCWILLQSWFKFTAYTWM